MNNNKVFSIMLVHLIFLLFMDMLDCYALMILYVPCRIHILFYVLGLCYNIMMRLHDKLLIY